MLFPLKKKNLLSLQCCKGLLRWTTIHAVSQLLSTDRAYLLDVATVAVVKANYGR